MNQIRRSLILGIFALMVLQIHSQNRASLGIGDKLPDMDLGMIINYSKSNARFSDFNGKALIISYWAPWCEPCLRSFPKLDSFQKKYGDKLQVLYVTAENKDFAARLLRNMQNAKNLHSIMSVVEDTRISALFWHRLLPHYVWIDPNGFVKAVTGSESFSEANITKLIEGKDLNLPVKADNREYDSRKPLFFSGQVNPVNELLYHSILTKYVQGVPNASSRGKNWISCPNHSIIFLFKIAFSQFRLPLMDPNRLILEGFDKSDSLSVGLFDSTTRSTWKEIKYENLYSYELVVPDTNPSIDELFGFMQQDLNRLFTSKGISGILEKRRVKVMALVRMSGADKLRTGGGTSKENSSQYFFEIKNKPLSQFVLKMQTSFNHGDLAIVDETNYKGNVDIELNANLSNYSELNKALAKYDLQFVEKEKDLDMIILKKRPTQNNSLSGTAMKQK